MLRKIIAKALINRINTEPLTPATFSRILQQSCLLLNFTKQDGTVDEAKVADELDTSVPLVRRWLSGSVLPPAGKIVLRFIKEKLERVLDE